MWGVLTPLAFGILAFAALGCPLCRVRAGGVSPGLAPLLGRKSERAQAGHSLTLNLKLLPLALLPQALARSGSQSPEGGVWPPLVWREEPQAHGPTPQDLPPAPALRLLGNFPVLDSSTPRTEDAGGDASQPNAKQKEEA